MYTDTCTYAYTDAYTYTETYTHTDRYTFTYTYIHIYVDLPKDREKIFVGGLPHHCTLDMLTAHFSTLATVVSF